MNKLIFTLSLILISGVSLVAQISTNEIVTVDTVIAPNRLYQFNPKQLILPSAFILYGAIGVVTENKNWLDAEIQKKVVNQWNTPFKSYSFDDYLLALPALSVYGLNMVGVKGKHTFVDRSVILGTSTLISLGFIQIFKPLTHNLRPDNSTYDSWPSGHTTLAFAGAEFVRMEYKDKSAWYGVAAYGVASTVGAMRIYNNRHWFTDVVAGAGFGILSTKMAYWIFPTFKKCYASNKIGNNNTKVNLSIIPSYSSGMSGFYLAATF